MKVLIITAKDPERQLLLKLHTEELIGEVKKLIASRKNPEAIASILKHGKYEDVFQQGDPLANKADIILTENRASWQRGGE